MEELLCSECGDHLGWLTDSGPRGMAYCDECYESEEGLEEDYHQWKDNYNRGYEGEP